MDDEGMKIGEVAERTGLSIRSLRHYDDVGVVSPSGKTPGGFRLYSERDVERILLVRRMKPLQFTLEEMREFLDAAENPDSPGARATIERVHEEARNRLAKLRQRVGYAEEFLGIIEEL
ncbi:MerR family transcriptional regulator [Corynebacterium humireducens NBRC 106098 = DSM 45392]|uniref:MerR family transcriptional regulator n=1 Tax=Corynebacterium humireducens NBRC 106098 = DSM 45392 TaxID=1223515 RepID=A0A0B5D7T0_9CORY|nr:MerR family transcriptional regulator [Corynebacterium humireducens]AJE32308.1 MerR family transcriptional regulator [Corynebacterium humireducens NBRC 106098 = DSM 45392]